MSTKKVFNITRTLKARRQLVWDVWTKSEHLAKWFAPTGFTTKVHKMDLKPQGIFHYSMTTPDGFEMWGKWIFRDLKEPEYLQLIQHFSDAEGGLGQHPAAPTWPKHTLSTTTLTEQGNETVLSLNWEPYEATDEEIETFNAAFDSMNQGWGGTFANLENYLAKIQ